MTKMKTGALVKLKRESYCCPTRKALIAVCHSEDDRLVGAYGDWGFMNLCRDEFSISRDQSEASRFIPMRLYLPYGLYFCEDGSKVLYSRDYCPLWSMNKNGEVAPIHPDTEIIYKDGHQEWFFDDLTLPTQNKKILKKCLSILEEWGVSDKLPLFATVMFNAIRKGDRERLMQPNRFYLQKNPHHQVFGGVSP